MSIYIIAYIAAAIAFFAADMVWLTIVAKQFYADQLGDLMAPDIRIGIAAGFYAMYVVGIVIFAIRPALDSGDWRQALMFGALFGFFCYATYDFTNMATIRDWPVRMSLVDIVWGTFVTGMSATAGYLAARWWNGS